MSDTPLTDKFRKEETNNERARVIGQSLVLLKRVMDSHAELEAKLTAATTNLATTVREADNLRLLNDQLRTKLAEGKAERQRILLTSLEWTAMENRLAEAEKHIAELEGAQQIMLSIDEATEKEDET